MLHSNHFHFVLFSPDFSSEYQNGRFLEKDGWKTLNEWLKTAKESGNQEFLKELLSLLQRCPVTLERLKENDTPKVIKNLSRTSQDEEIVEIASTVVQSWTEEIGKCTESKESKVKGSKRRVKHDSGESGVSEENKKAKTDSSEFSPSNGLDGKSGGEGSCDSNESTSNSSSVVDNLKAAPSTVVMKPGKSNLDGLMSSTSNSVEKKGTKVQQQNSSSISGGPSNKMNKVDPLVNDAVNGSNASSKKSSSKVESPNPSSSTAQSVTNNNSGAAKTVIKESDFFANVLAIEPVNKPAMKRKIVRQPKIDGGDGEECMSRRGSITDENTSSRSPPDESGDHLSLSTPPANKMVRRCNSIPQSCPIAQGPAKSFPRGCLSVKSSSEKKKVRWLPDQWIQAVKLFEVEDNERVNMYRINSLAAMNERKGEAAALRQSNQIKNEPGSEGMTLAPCILIPIDVPMPQPVPGRNSAEKGLQELRHRTVLASIIMNKNQGPESPTEPDRCEIIAMTASNVPPKQIPIEDLNGTVTDFSGTIQPEPKFNAMYGQAGFVATNSNYQLDPLIASQSALVSSSYAFSSTYNNSLPTSGQPAYNPRVVDYGTGSNPNNQTNNQTKNGFGRGRNSGGPRKIPCKDFINGRCKYTNCKFSHDIPPSMMTQRARSTNMNSNRSPSDELDWGT